MPYKFLTGICSSLCSQISAYKLQKYRNNFDQPPNMTPMLSKLCLPPLSWLEVDMGKFCILMVQLNHVNKFKSLRTGPSRIACLNEPGRHSMQTKDNWFPEIQNSHHHLPPPKW
jgi:hypothetical protein